MNQVNTQTKPEWVERATGSFISSNPKSTGYLGGRWLFAIPELVATAGLVRP